LSLINQFLDNSLHKKQKLLQCSDRNTVPTVPRIGVPIRESKQGLDWTIGARLLVSSLATTQVLGACLDTFAMAKLLLLIFFSAKL
jgi:hypothetical protein